MNTLILDNGSWSIKGKWALPASPAVTGDEEREKEKGWSVVPNTVSKSKSSKGIFVGEEVESCRDHSGMVYRRPFQLGHLVNWQVQATIWDHLFTRGPLKASHPSLPFTLIPSSLSPSLSPRISHSRSALQKRPAWW